jgi:CHAD domain-containing protein
LQLAGLCGLWYDVRAFSCGQLNIELSTYIESRRGMAVEIEAKFRIPDADVFERLLALDALGAFRLGPVRVMQVRDAYLDTADRLILAGGYSCRQRVYDDRVIVTLKSVRKGEGPIHRREEYEVSLDAPAESPDAWPESAVRDRVRQLIGWSPLGLLFEMNQTRRVRPVYAGDRSVAELSLDQVQLSTDDRHLTYYELEVELREDGGESDLLAIVTHLRNEWGLPAESLSKFEQALVFIADTAPPRRLLTPEERATCARLAQRSDLHGRRAAVLLALDDGVTQAAAGQAAHLSERRVRYWAAAFRNRRLGIFPDRVLTMTASSEGGDDDLLPDNLDVEASRPEPQPWPIDLLLDKHNVDRTHAGMVARHAGSLFDHLQPIHLLPQARRTIVTIAAQLHDIGVRSDPSRHHVAGHDLLLRHPPAGLSEPEHRIVAFAALAHSRKARPGKILRWHDRFLGDLPADLRTEALAVAALIRVADGLDYSQGNTQIARVDVRPDGVAVEVTGPFASVDAERAAAKSDLWREQYGVPLVFSPIQAATDGQPTETPITIAPGAASAPVPRAKKADRKAVTAPTMPDYPTIAPRREAVDAPAAPELATEPGLLPDDTMAEGARKTLWFHFQRMLAHEEGTRLGEDPEELHDMRVATRRMRAAFPIFQDYLDMRVMQPHLKGLRRTGRLLGAVRDLDVFYEKTQRYLDTLPPGRRSELDPLLEAWHARREQARAAMLAYLDSPRYARFVAQFGEFLSTPGAGALPTVSASGEPLPHRLRHVVPGALYRRLAEVRAFDEWLSGPDVPLSRYHQLRIASKGLRYALEYFREILGPTAKPLIEAVKGLQDLLGDVNDAVVACNLLRDYLTWGTWGHDPDQRDFADSIIVSPGAAAYLAYRQSELQELLGRFPEVWATFHGQQFGRWLADAVAEL